MWEGINGNLRTRRHKRGLDEESAVPRGKKVIVTKSSKGTWTRTTREEGSFPSNLLKH